MKQPRPSPPPPHRWRRLVVALLGAALAQPPMALAQNENNAAANPPIKSRTPVTLNFVNADIEAVSRAIGAMLDRQLLVDPRVKGTITLYSEQPLTPREAYLNYLAALRGLGFTVVESGGLLKVVPEADAKLQTGTVSIGDVTKKGDQVITQVFRLAHENANNLVAVLRPLITPNNTINVNPGNNSLVITDYADNLHRLAKIIAALDIPNASDFEVIPLQHAVAADLAPLIQRLATEGGAPGVPGAPVPIHAAGGQVVVLTDPHSNSLIVRASNPSRMATVRSLVDKLDRANPNGGPAGNIYVVHLKNADATKLAQVLRAAFTVGGGGAGATPVSTTPTPATQTLGTSGANAGISSAAAAPLNPSASPSTGGFIQADPATNSLVITAPEPLYRQLRTMIDQLDSRRAQVYIESMIVEVSGDNAADFGFQWQGLIGKNGDKYGLAAGTNFGSTGNLVTLSTLGSTLGGTSGSTGGSVPTVPIGEGLNIALIKDFGGVYGLAAIARLLQSQTNTNIVSTPNLITLDNEEAKIIVGSNVPFITGQFTPTGTNISNPFQTIERKDVGITLRIKPQIGENGVVRMQIFQESSSLSDRVAPGTSNAGPSTDKRSIESTVTVDDGQILVLGGLIEDKYTENKSKVPLLGDIPYIGALFRSESRTKTRTNLMVFLRPVVMRDAETANRISTERYDLIRGQQQAAQPRPSVLVPINESPVVPPLQRLERAPAAPLAVPPSSPGAQNNVPGGTPPN